MGITQDITLRGLTPSQVIDLQHFVDQVLMRGNSWVVDRKDDARRAANELINGPLSPAPVAAPSPAPAAVSAPAAPNGHAAAPGAAVADAPRDSRGVPHHPDFHAALTSTSGGLKGDGTWKRKRGHDEAAADAYEAQYLRPQRQAEAEAIVNPTQVSPAAMVTPGTAAPHTPSVASGADTVGVTSTPLPLVAFPVPPLAPPPPPAAPTQEQLEQLWTELALNNRVGTSHSDYLASWIGWPIVANDAYRLSAENRTTVYNWLSQYR